MPSRTERRHFDRIAAGEAALNEESIRTAAVRSPGINIEIGLELSEFASAFGADLSRADEVPLIRLWQLRGAPGYGRIFSIGTVAFRAGARWFH